MPFAIGSGGVDMDGDEQDVGRAEGGAMGVDTACEVEYPDGKKGKVTFALRNDNQWKCWEVDGGI